MKSNENNEQPLYILKFNEGIMKPKVENKTKDIIKYLLGFATILIILVIIIFGFRVLREFSFSIFICYCIAIGYLIKNGGYERIPSPCELWFYENYLVQYCPKRYYSKNNIRKEYYKFNYKDIKRCLYRSVVNKFDIFGIVEATFYKYDKDGNVDSVPKHHITADSISVFYTVFEPNIDFIKEIEEHSPIKVEIENS